MFAMWLTDHQQKPWTKSCRRGVDYSSLKVFGCPAYTCIPSDQRSKLDSKSLKVYKIWDPINKKKDLQQRCCNDPNPNYPSGFRIKGLWVDRTQTRFDLDPSEDFSPLLIGPTKSLGPTVSAQVAHLGATALFFFFLFYFLLSLFLLFLPP